MSMNQRFGQYRSILSQSPQHERAIKECIRKQSGLDDYDKIFLHVCAPAAVEYVRWILEQAEHDKMRRLYFLSRDGWLFYQLAEKFVEKYNYPIELRYLHVSRYSMRSAGYHLIGEDCLDKICVGMMDATFEKLMKQASLTDAEAYEIAQLAGYEQRYRQKLSYRTILQLKETLRGIPEFLVYVSAHAKACYDTAVSYLKQEGLFDAVSYAVVDSGWMGTLKQSMELLTGRPVMGYYFGLYEYPKDADISDYKAFYFQPYSQLKRKVYFSNCLFEAIFSSPEQMVVRYEPEKSPDDGKSYVPVGCGISNPNTEKMKRNLLLLGQYADEYLKTVQKDDGSGGQAGMIYRLFHLFMGRPESREAEVFGALRFCDDMLESKLIPLAEAFLAEEITERSFINRMLIKMNIRKKAFPESAWPEGSVVLYGKRINCHLFQEYLYKYVMYTRKAAGKGKKHERNDKYH